MSHPEYLYWALILLIALPSAPFNRVAGVIVADRIMTQLAWEVGLPEPPTQAVIFGLALFPCLHHWHFRGARFQPMARTKAQRVTAWFFAPLTVAALVQYFDPVAGWWAVFWLACLQAVITPLGNDWATAREGWLALKDISWIDGLFRRIRHADRGVA